MRTAMLTASEVFRNFIKIDVTVFDTDQNFGWVLYPDISASKACEL